MNQEQIATRDWYTRARVRITGEKISTTPIHTRRTFHPGEELEMFQWGHAGQEVKRNAWWTSFDIDGAFIIESDKVEVLEVLNEVPPV